MELLSPDLVALFLGYGSFAFGFGVLLIASMELMVYGVVKAMGFFRL